jgi:hypothetical protein
MGDEDDTIAPSSVRSRTHWSYCSSRNESKFVTTNLLTAKKVDCIDAVLNDGSRASSVRVRVRFCLERWIWSQRVWATVRARLTKT